MKSKKSKRKNEKHFYNNKQRNQKWTEQETGRYIDFADKYSPDKKDGEFDESRVIANNIKLKKERKKKTAKKSCRLFWRLSLFASDTPVLMFI